MDQWGKHFDALLNLLFGGAFAIVAVYFKHKRLGIVLGLSFGVAFVALGSLDLVGIIAPEWIAVSGNMILGIAMIWWSISALYAPPSPSFPEWTKWAWLVFGVGLVLLAAVRVLHYYLL